MLWVICQKTGNSPGSSGVSQKIGSDSLSEGQISQLSFSKQSEGQWQIKGQGLQGQRRWQSAVTEGQWKGNGPCQGQGEKQRQGQREGRCAKGVWSGQLGPQNRSASARQTLILRFWLGRPPKSVEIHLPTAKGMLFGQPGPPNRSCLARKTLIWRFWLARPHNSQKCTARQPLWPARAPESELLSTANSDLGCFADQTP